MSSTQDRIDEMLSRVRGGEFGGRPSPSMNGALPRQQPSLPPLPIGNTNSPNAPRRPPALPFIPPRMQDNAETERRLKAIKEKSGILKIHGIEFKTEIRDMEHLEELGNGTCGHVVKMRHKPSGKVIAVKQMRRSGNADENKRIIMDIEVILKSNCNYIVECLGCFITESEMWICMEHMDTCFDKLLKRIKQPIPEHVLGKVSVATVEALAYLKDVHNVIHRDVKPSNILLDSNGNVKLCDFGISGRLVDSMAQSRSAGCAAYMAPERIEPDPRDPDYDVRADVWSLGITLVELATARFPYQDCKTDFEVLTKVLGTDPPSLPQDKDFSPDMRDFVSCCLIKDKRQRPKYTELKKHSFIKTYQVRSVDVGKWYKETVWQVDNRLLSRNSPPPYVSYFNEPSVVLTKSLSPPPAAPPQPKLVPISLQSQPNSLPVVQNGGIIPKSEPKIQKSHIPVQQGVRTSRLDAFHNAQSNSVPYHYAEPKTAPNRTFQGIQPNSVLEHPQELRNNTFQGSQSIYLQENRNSTFQGAYSSNVVDYPQENRIRTLPEPFNHLDVMPQDLLKDHKRSSSRTFSLLQAYQNHVASLQKRDEVNRRGFPVGLCSPLPQRKFGSGNGNPGGPHVQKSRASSETRWKSPCPSPLPLRSQFQTEEPHQYHSGNTSPIILQRFYHQQKQQQLMKEADEAEKSDPGKKRFSSYIKLQLTGDKSGRSSRHQSPEPPPRLNRGTSGDSPSTLRKAFLETYAPNSPSLSKRYVSPSPPVPPPRRLSESTSVPSSPQHLRARFHYTPEPQRRTFQNSNDS